MNEEKEYKMKNTGSYETGVGSAVKLGDVPSALDELTTSLDELDGALVRFLDRLKAISRQDDKKDECSIPISCAKCELGEMIRGRTRTIRMMTNRITLANSRLEL